MGFLRRMAKLALTGTFAGACVAFNSLPSAATPPAPCDRGATVVGRTVGCDLSGRILLVLGTKMSIPKNGYAVTASSLSSTGQLLVHDEVTVAHIAGKVYAWQGPARLDDNVIGISTPPSPINSPAAPLHSARSCSVIQYNWSATHEFGHAFGLNHVSESSYPTETMSSAATSCSLADASLGRSDYAGLYDHY